MRMRISQMIRFVTSGEVTWESQGGWRQQKSYHKAFQPIRVFLEDIHILAAKNGWLITDTKTGLITSASPRSFQVLIGSKWRSARYTDIFCKITNREYVYKGTVRC